MTRKRGRNEGSVYQRESDGRWVAGVTVGYKTVVKDGVEKRVQKRKVVYGLTQAEVLKKKKKLEAKYAAGKSDDLENLTLADYLTQTWLPAIKPGVAPLTYAPYKLHVEKHIVPRIGHARLLKMLPMHVQQFYSDMAAAGISPALMKKVGTTLGTALAYAETLRILPFNPARGVKKPKAEKPDFHVLEPFQVAKFLEEAKKDRHYAYYVFALDSGAGPGEAFALEWTDVNFDTGMVSIIHSLEDNAGYLRVKGPKRATRKRHIRLSAHTLDVLHDQRKRAMASGMADAPIFHDTDGKHLRNGNVTKRSFKLLLAQAALPAIRLYDLRHTCATLLLLANVPAKVVSERLGHASVTITLNTYSHVLPDMQKQAADALHRVFTTIWSAELLNKDGKDAAAGG